MTQVTHYLKTVPESFAPIVRGDKTFEIRKNDRGFKVGDELVLIEWSEATGPTGRELRRKVTYLIEGAFGLPPDVCVMAIPDEEAK